jgi:hypothetical protein
MPPTTPVVQGTSIEVGHPSEKLNPQSASKAQVSV